MMDTCDASDKPFVLNVDEAFDRQKLKWRKSSLPQTRKKKKPGQGIIYIGHGSPSRNTSTEKLNGNIIHMEGSKPYLNIKELVGTNSNCILNLENDNCTVDDEDGDKNNLCTSYSPMKGVEYSSSQMRFIDKINSTPLQYTHMTPDIDQHKIKLTSNKTHQHSSQCRRVKQSMEQSQKQKVKKPTVIISASDLSSDENENTCAVHSCESSTLQVLEENHGDRLALFYNKLYNHDQMTDVKVNVGNYSFSAHRVVLACFSPFFAELILNVKTNDRDKITLSHGVTPTGFKKILDYMYTKELAIEVESLAEILQAACVLRITDLQGHCLSIFKAAKIPALLDILETAHKQGVRNICLNLILQKISSVPFKDVTKLPEFNELCGECLGLILALDELCISSEYDLALAVIKWVECAPDERIPKLDSVFTHVRLENMNSSEIVKLGQDANILMQNVSTRERLMRVQWNKRCLEIGFDCAREEVPERPRKCVAKCKELKHTKPEGKQRKTQERSSNKQEDRNLDSTKLKVSHDKSKQSLDRPKQSANFPNGNEKSKQVKERRSDRNKQAPEQTNDNRKIEKRSDKQRNKEEISDKHMTKKVGQEYVNLIQDTEEILQRYESNTEKMDAAHFGKSRPITDRMNGLSQTATVEPGRKKSGNVSKPSCSNNTDNNTRIDMSRMQVPLQVVDETQKVVSSPENKSFISNRNNNHDLNKTLKVNSYVQRTIENHIQQFHCMEMSNNKRFKTYDIHKRNECTASCKTPSLVHISSDKLGQVEDGNQKAENLDTEKQYNVNVIGKFPTNITQPKALTIGNYLYMIGGTDEGILTNEYTHSSTANSTRKASNLVYRYNISAKEWEEWFPLWEARTLHCAVEVGKRIYTLGGLGLHGYCLSSVESMDSNNDRCGWKYETNMPSARCSAACATINDKIYLAGGVRNTKPFDLNHVLSSVLCYNTSTKVWTQIESLLYPRFGSSLVSIDSELFILGGVYKNEDERLVTTNDIDTWNGYTWVRRAKMQHNRCGSKVFVQGFLIIIVGGYERYGDERSILTQSEVLNTDVKVWENGFNYGNIDNIDNRSVFLM